MTIQHSTAQGEQAAMIQKEPSCERFEQYFIYKYVPSNLVKISLSINGFLNLYHLTF